MPCSVIHDHSCEMHFVKRFLLVFNLAYKFYIPIHILPALIFKRRKLTKEPIKILRAAAKNILKSTLFISCYVSFYWYFICKIKNYRKKTDKWNIILAASLCCFSVLWEPSNRRSEMALYMFPRFLESAMLYLVDRGYVKPIPKGEVVAFAIALSFIMYCYQNEEKNIKPSYHSLFKKFFGQV